MVSTRQSHLCTLGREHNNHYLPPSSIPPSYFSPLLNVSHPSNIMFHGWGSYKRPLSLKWRHLQVHNPPQLRTYVQINCKYQSLSHAALLFRLLCP